MIRVKLLRSTRALEMTENRTASGVNERTLLNATDRLGNRRGAILLLVAVSMVALMGLLVMAIDGGLVQRQRRIAQLAADAAVKAGAIEIYRDRTDSVAASARSEATRNGFTHGVGGRVVTVTYPSTEPGFSGPFFVQVAVRDTVRTIFGSLIGRALVPVNARAVGGVTGTTNNCIVSLEDHDDHAIIVQSGGQVVAQGCNVAVNSDHPDALCVTASEGGSLQASQISITGGYDSGCAGSVSSYSTGQTPVTDPLASVQLQVSDTSGACNGAYGAYDHIDVSMTLNPGVYCGGIGIAKSTTTVTFNPGLYVIKGGGLSVSSDATINGTEVSFINLNPPLPESPNKFDVINIAGSTANLSAMTTGTLAGVLFYTPLNQGDPGHVQLNNLHSAAFSTLTGTLYFPDQELHIGSGHDAGVPTTLNLNGGIIAGIINFAADARVNVTGFNGGEPYGILRASIVR
jgi:hypothetical protein